MDVDPAVGLELARGALADEAAPVRAAGARVVGRVGDASSGALLRPALQDEDIAVRLAAVEALGECGAADRASDLEALVRHPDGALAGPGDARAGAHGRRAARGAPGGGRATRTRRW